ncbi:MAG TPA: hypothetical protein PKN80_05595, partial [bacterium]|nr:hypothetical protein [bacterium]
LVITPRSDRWAAVTLFQGEQPVGMAGHPQVFSAAGEALLKFPETTASWRRLDPDEKPEQLSAGPSGWEVVKPTDSIPLGPNQRIAESFYFKLEPGRWWLMLSGNGLAFNPRIFVNGREAAARDYNQVDLAGLTSADTNTVTILYDTTAPARQNIKETRVALSLKLIRTEAVGLLGYVGHPQYAMLEGLRIFPRTTFFILDRNGRELLDRAVVDLSKLKIEPARIQYASILNRSTAENGFCRPAGSRYRFDNGQPGWFWGGHENHPPTHATTDRYVESYRSMGVNVLRLISMRHELVRDYRDNSLDPVQLDKLHYLIYRLGQAGIYFHFTLSSYGNYEGDTDPGGTEPGIWATAWDRGSMEKTGRSVTGEGQMTSPRIRELDKQLFRNLLTSKNPYNGLRICDDPTVMTVELANEIGLGGRRFDWSIQYDPEVYKYQMHLWNQYLLKKYGPREVYYQDYALGKLWKAEDYYKGEDPAADAVSWPQNFKGSRTRPVSYYRYYLDGVNRIANPRISDAMECLSRIQEDWFRDLYAYLKNECGVKVGIGASSDGFNIYQVGARLANARSLDVTDGQAYGGAGQITRGFGGWGYLTDGFYVYNRPSFAREWGSWWTSSAQPWEFIVLAAVLARYNGYDGFTHHKLGGLLYPVRDPRRYTINPCGDIRRSAFSLAAWIIQRSRIEEIEPKIIIGFPEDDVFYGGANIPFSNHLGTGFLTGQLSTEEYYFKKEYDGPADRIVFHAGRGPTGDYTKARHAILWCHGNSDRFAQDYNYKEKWFASHGIKFKEGESWYLDDHYLATTEDLRGPNQEVFLGKLYEALKRWGHPLPFSPDEILKGWWSPDRKAAIEFEKMRMTVDREDLQLYLGRFKGVGSHRLSRLSVASDEEQLSAACVPFDTADFRTSRQLLVWCLQNAAVTVKLPFVGPAEVYAVNHLGSRIYRVRSTRPAADEIGFKTARSFDISYYEIVPAAGR